MITANCTLTQQCPTYSMPLCASSLQIRLTLKDLILCEPQSTSSWRVLQNLDPFGFPFLFLLHQGFQDVCEWVIAQFLLNFCQSQQQGLCHPVKAHSVWINVASSSPLQNYIAKRLSTGPCLWVNNRQVHVWKTFPYFDNCICTPISFVNPMFYFRHLETNKQNQGILTQPREL